LVGTRRARRTRGHGSSRDLSHIAFGERSPAPHRSSVNVCKFQRPDRASRYDGGLARLQISKRHRRVHSVSEHPASPFPPETSPSTQSPAGQTNASIRRCREQSSEPPTAPLGCPCRFPRTNLLLELSAEDIADLTGRRCAICRSLFNIRSGRPLLGSGGRRDHPAAPSQNQSPAGPRTWRFAAVTCFHTLKMETSRDSVPRDNQSGRRRNLRAASASKAR
jgi:hypothetical protein